MPNGYYLVSACIGGLKCRYDGSSAITTYLKRLLLNKSVILVCPEKMGGLPTPRDPAQIVLASALYSPLRTYKMINPGVEVWKNRATVINSKGKNLTGVYKKGTRLIMNLIRPLRIIQAYLKTKSPACGCNRVYIRNRKTNQICLVKGDGVFTARLKKYKIKVIPL